MPDCIYLRKSRVDLEAEQSGRGDTLARHERALISNAALQGRSVTKVYREIVSGETIASRPEMTKLLQDVEAGMWEAVHVMEIERLARGDTLDQGIVSQAFLYSKTLIITPQKTYDPQNEFDEEYFEFGLFMSRREYKTINRRQQAGRRASMREGKWVANKAPYGYERVKLEGQKGWTLQAKEPESSYVADMFRWASEGAPQADGSLMRLGTARIARKLNEQGVPAPIARGWLPGSVRDILRNISYTGKIRWGRRGEEKQLKNGVISITRARKAQDAYEIYDGLHQPLVDAARFAEVGAILAGGAPKLGPKQLPIKNPMAGLIYCAGCGRSMVRRPYGNGRRATLICPYTDCATMGSDLEVVERALFTALGHWLRDFELEQAQSEKPQDELVSMQSAIDGMQRQIKALHEQQQRAFELVEQNVYSPEQFIARSGELGARIAQMKEKLSTQTRAHKKLRTQALAMGTLIPSIRHVLDSYWQASSEQEKNALLRTVISKAVYAKSAGGRYKESNMELFLYPVIPIETPHV